jgi:Flp pilus assembly pilin Flp
MNGKVLFTSTPRTVMKGNAVVEYAVILAFTILLVAGTARMVGTHVQRAMNRAAERIR